MSDQLALNAAVDPPQVAEHDESAPLRPRPSPQRERHSPPAAANASASATASKTTTRMQVKRHTKQWHRLKRYLWQQRALKVTTACTMFSSLLWIVCVATDNWLVYHFNEPHTDSQQNKILYYKSGLWRSCVITEKGSDCKTHLFLSGDSRSYDFFYGNMTATDYDNTLSVRRSEIAFAIITLVLMVTGNTFAVYAIRHVRYTYKRLTAGVHVLTGICALVCLEIVISIPKTVAATTNGSALKQSSTAKPPGHTHVPSYGFSLVLAWMVFSVYILAGLLFLIFSKKLKGPKAPTAEVKDANEPLQLSRP